MSLPYTFYLPFKHELMKIWHISDTHTYHNLLIVPEVDMVIFSGDMSIPRELPFSINQCMDFIEWFAKLPIKHKVCIAGNHDIAIERKAVNGGDMMSKGIIYLENNSTIIEGIKIWGSPITPSFGIGWAFNRKRDKLYDLWASIPDDTDIVISHGPPKGILDHSYNQDGNVYERCGCAALAKRMRLLEPKLCLFGHIHTTEDIINAGVLQQSGYKTIYSNGSVVTDGKFGKLTSNGNILTI